MHNWIVTLFIAVLCALPCRHTHIEGMVLVAKQCSFFVTLGGTFGCPLLKLPCFVLLVRVGFVDLGVNRLVEHSLEDVLSEI